jgi:hypothetical protein
MRVYKNPVTEGDIDFGMWDDEGTLLTSTTQTWVEDHGGWVMVEWDDPVEMAEGETYHWGYLYPEADHAYPASEWALNGLDYTVYPLYVTAETSTSAGIKSGGSWYRAGASLTFGDLPADRKATNFYLDPIAEWDVNTPGYEGGREFFDQWANGGSRFDFPISVFGADPQYLQGYMDIGVNTLDAGDIRREDFRAAVKAADMDWYPDIQGGDTEAPVACVEDPELAVCIRGYQLDDEPDLNVPFNSPTVLKGWRNTIRKVDSTRPIWVGLSRLPMEQMTYVTQPVGMGNVALNLQWREYLASVDFSSLDCYGITRREPFNFQPGWFARYGIWIYPMQIHRMRNDLTDRTMPVFGVVETTSAYPGEPTPTQVERCVWSLLIAGAKGIEYFDHRFPSSAPVTQDFAAMLHDEDMSEAIAALNARMQTLADALWAPEADLITDWSSTGVLAVAQGGEAAGVRIPLHYSSRVVDDTTYFFVQSIRDGTAGVCTFTVPSAPNTTITVLGEARTITSDEDGVFTDTFFGDYAYHLYSLVSP